MANRIDWNEDYIKSFDYLIIPTNNIAGAIQDELGLVQLTVGIGEEYQKTGEMMYCVNKESFRRFDV